MGEEIKLDKLPEDEGQKGVWVKTKEGGLERRKTEEEKMKEKFPIKGEGFVATKSFGGGGHSGKGIEFKPGEKSEGDTGEELKKVREETEEAFKKQEEEK
jgi:hypothetical protein